jgi:hypothetical protein
MSTNWTFGGSGQYTASWDGTSQVTVTQTAGGAFLVSFAARSLEAAVASPEYQAIQAVPPPNPISGLSLVATTGLSGFTMVNGTPNLFSWTAPSDGNMHRLFLVGEQIVTGALTGGKVTANFTDPSGAVQTRQIFAPSNGVGFSGPQALTFTVAPGSVCAVQQNSAVTAGAAVMYLEMWAS